ncbi:MAG TPA: multicopper oxidase domain-containing protein, partial [Candidatus Binataceae bacterium]
IEFVADRAGDWMLHCHLPHHMMNQMVSNVGPMTRSGATQVPLYPQDAFMESPMMAMDKAVERPETSGLPMNWTGYVGGMMTLVRIMPPDRFDQIQRLRAQQVQK